MSTTATPPTVTCTLGQRMAEGKIPPAETLRLAMILADKLRKMHDAGSAHGAVSASTVVIDGAGLELLPGLSPAGLITPYTAPELLAGATADARSDIFSFAAILYEMLTGHRAFEGDTAAALAADIAQRSPAPTGSPAVDRLLGPCLAKDPAARPQRMQRILLELKLLSVAARRAETPTPDRVAEALATIRTDARQMETRVAERLEEHQRNVADLERSAADALGSLREQIAAVSTQLSAAQEQAKHAEESYAAAGEQITARVGQNLDAILERLTRIEQNVDGLGQRMAATEQGLATLRERASGFQEQVDADLHGFEQTLKGQAAAIDSARTAMAQTDDLVERVVEALELLQTTVIEQAEARCA